jgi:hypothetical protein
MTSPCLPPGGGNRGPVVNQVLIEKGMRYDK